MEKNELAIEELIRALQAEKWGYEFYLGASQRAKDLKAKKIFLRLTQEEVDHQLALKKLLEKMGEDWDIEGLTPMAMPGTKLPSLKKIAQSRISDKEALEIGIKMEEAAINFYTELGRMVNDKEDKKFFKQLVDFEKEHLTSLQKSYSAIFDKS